MPDSRSPRRITAALAVAVVATTSGLAASAPASAAVAEDTEICQYSFDQFWRKLPVKITGTVTDGTTPLSPSTAVAPGTKVHLEDATVTATLPDWVETFGYESGYLPLGNGETPLNGWIAFEATNTLEGVTAPIPFSTTGRSTIVTSPSGVVDEDGSTFPIDPAALAEQTWTATGGPIVVRQALGTKMAPIPAGRTGGLIQVNGTLYVEANLGEGASALKLALDCTSGDQVLEGADHTDRLPTALGTFRAPNYAGGVNGTPMTGPVDASVATSVVPRAAAGTAASVTGATLDLRLTSAQVAEWLGHGTTTAVTGTLNLASVGATPASRAVAVSTSVTTPASGTATVSIPVPTTQWTPTGAGGADVRTADAIVLTAGSGPTAKTLVLNRNTAFAAPAADRAYPFAQILGPDPRVRFDEPDPGGPGGPRTDNPPPIDLGGGGTIAPPPVVVPPVVVPPKADPKPVGKITPVKIGGFTLKQSKGRLKITLQNLVAGVTKGRFSLVTRTKYKVGGAKKAKRITLLRATSFSLPKGRKQTLAVKLSKDATALLRGRKSVKATLTVTPAAGSTQKVVSGTVTVRR